MAERFFQALADLYGCDVVIKAPEIFAEDKASGISCGVNADGDLFFGNGRSGYNLPDTPENREYIMADFARMTA